MKITTEYLITSDKKKKQCQYEKQALVTSYSMGIHMKYFVTEGYILKNKNTFAAVNT